MDAPRLPDPRVLLATPQRASLRVGRRFRRLKQDLRVSATAGTTDTTATPTSMVDVAAGLATRPTVAIALVALGIAVLLHVGFGGLTSNIRVRKKAVALTTTSVAVAETPLPEDPLPMPPPPPPVMTTTKLPSTAPAAPSSTSVAPASLAAPSLPGVAAGSGGWAMANVGNGGPTTAVSSTMPTATATPQPALVPARPLGRAPPRFPARAQRDGINGFVVVQIHVDASGQVKDVRVVDSQPAGIFDEAAIDSVRRWTFVPASADGVPQASWLRQTLRFQLEGT